MVKIKKTISFVANPNGNLSIIVKIDFFYIDYYLQGGGRLVNFNADQVFMGIVAMRAVRCHCCNRLHRPNY